VAILFVAIAIAVRYFAPHYVFTEDNTPLLVPALTVLMMLAVLIGLLRRKIELGFPSLLIIQWLLFGWAVICLVVNEGLGAAGELASIDYPRDMIFITTVVVAVDNLKRFKILIGTVMVTMLLIGAFALPQTWGERRCAEWMEGDMANLVPSEYPCAEVSECFKYEKKIPRAFDGVGSRNWRCERIGPFNIAAYIGRVRWTGVFDDSNNLGGAIAMLVPLLIGWFWKDRRWYARLGWPLVTLAYLAVIVGTGSRGAQLGFLGGVGLVLWGLWGRKVIYVGAAGVVALLLIVVIFGKTMVREENRFEGSTKISDRYRRDAMKAGYRLWSSHPFFGVGYAKFEKYHLIDPHNAFLASAGELGTLGLLLYGLGLWSIFKAMWVIRRRAKEAGHVLLERLALGGLGANAAGVFSLAFFLSTYDKFSWLVPFTFSTGLLRAAKQELEGFEFKITYKDLLYSVPLTLLIVGGLYVALMAAYTFS
jgi:O-Antigen ligase